MKAVPKVNKEGLYLEDTLVDDSFTGVVPFYADLPAADPEDEQPEHPEPEIVGSIVGVSVTPGLYLPRFDLAAWEAYQDAVAAAEETYQAAYTEWGAKPEDERGEPPTYITPEEPELWGEGLTPEEIEALSPPKQPTELECLQQENMELKLALTELAEANETDRTQMQLALAELAELVAVH